MESWCLTELINWQPSFTFPHTRWGMFHAEEAAPHIPIYENTVKDMPPAPFSLRQLTSAMFPGPAHKCSIHLEGMETFHSRPSEVSTLWTSNELHAASLIKKRYHDPWRRDDFYQGRLAACCTWQEKRVHEGIHKTVVKLLLRTLQRHSAGEGFQRIGVWDLSNLSEYFRYQEELAKPPN